MLEQNPITYFSQLQGAKNANVFQKYASLAAATIKRSFSQVMKGSKRHALQRVVREDAGSLGVAGTYSFLLFRKESEPPFMKGGGLVDIKHAFLLILELSRFVVVFKHGLTFDESIFADVMVPLSHDYLTNLFSGAQSAYERIALHNMSVSNQVVRSRTLEAVNLKTSMTTLGANRSIPKGFKVRTDHGSHTVTPSTSRIGSQGVSATVRDLLHWAKEIAAEIERDKASGGFMSNFATPCRVSDLPSHVVPSGVRLDISKLLAEIDDGSVRQVLFQKDAVSAPIALDQKGLQDIYDLTLQAFVVVDIGGQHIVTTAPLDESIGVVKVNKSSITLTLVGAILGCCVIEYADGDKVALAKWIGKAHGFTVVFSDPRYAYSGRSLYYDNNLSSTIDALLAIFVDGFDLSMITSEKGRPRATSKNFMRSSIFGAIENEIAQADSVLVCDDLGDEWADFIGLRADGQEPGISFYHAKHGKVGLGASGLHAVVAQALKNLSHLNPTPEEIDRKCESWGSDVYRLDGVESKIARIRRGGSKQQVGASFRKALSSPNANRKVYIVVSSISKIEVEAALLRMRGGAGGEPQMVQMLWLLTTFVGACKDVGANAYIVCNA